MKKAPSPKILLLVSWFTASAFASSCTKDHDQPGTPPPMQTKKKPLESSGKQRLRDVLELVQLGYGDLFERECRSLDFRVENMSTTETQEALKLVKEYNAFDGEKIALGLERFRGRISHYEFGREGSPVLYVHLPYWSGQREGAIDSNDRQKVSDEENKLLVKELRQLFIEKFDADEFNIMDYSDRVVRVWWD